MDMPTIITIIAIVIATVLAVLMVAERKSVKGETITLADAGAIAQQVQPLAADIKTGIEMIVLGIDQLRTKGHINTNEEAFQKAFGIARERWPGVDPDTLTVFIEGVYNATLGRNKPAPAAPPPPKTEGQPVADRIAEKLLGVEEPTARGPLLSREDELLDKWRQEQEAGGFDLEDPESDIPV